MKPANTIGSPTFHISCEMQRDSPATAALSPIGRCYRSALYILLCQPGENGWGPEFPGVWYPVLLLPGVWELLPGVW